jgi:hypothetical protein
VGLRSPVHSHRVCGARARQYRLAPAAGALTEARFQRMPLAFVGRQMFRWGGLNGTTLSFDGVYVTRGTSPSGSSWVKVSEKCWPSWARELGQLQPFLAVFPVSHMDPWTILYLLSQPNAFSRSRTRSRGTTTRSRGRASSRTAPSRTTQSSAARA